MTTIEINERTKKGKALLVFLKLFDNDNFIEILKTDKLQPNETTHKAFKEAETGKTKKFTNVSDLLEDLSIQK
jgi:hypothetical protein